MAHLGSGLRLVPVIKHRISIRPQSHNCCSTSAPGSVDLRFLNTQLIPRGGGGRRGDRGACIYPQNRWTLTIKKQNQTASYVSKFLHAVLHGFTPPPSVTVVLRVKEVRLWLALERRGGRRQEGEGDRGEEARLAAARRR